MDAVMNAMLLDAPGKPLRRAALPVPSAEGHDILVRVAACGVCRTDLHIVDGELAPRRLPLVPGHEIVGHVVAAGPLVRRFRRGQRVGVAWLAGSCGTCPYCLQGRENLCDRASFTGYDRHGGFADYTLADARFCFALPPDQGDAQAAPRALAAVRKGGTVVCAGIHMSDIPSFPYTLLWGERCVRSVANLTRADGEAFFRDIAGAPVAARVATYPLDAANEALADLRAGRIDGAAVLVPSVHG